MIDELMRVVKAFHDAKGFPVMVPLAEKAIALRSHLLKEELGELIEAMEAGDEVAALDGAADLLYVLIGTAVTFDWPLFEAFAEVHRSNMTKSVAQDRTHHPGKGKGYSPPNLKDLLERHKAARLSGSYQMWDQETQVRTQKLGDH